jgi:uncharacterized protein YndB with AHSA1/START domain
MMTEQIDTLQVRRTLRCAPERVFQAWTDPDQLQQWYAPSDDWSTPVAEVDLRVGGSYRIGLAAPGRAPFYEVGEFLEVAPPSRLVYTQRTEGGGSAEELVVSVEFIARDGATEVVVTERGYTDARVRDLHRRGWEGFLARLARVAGP